MIDPALDAGLLSRIEDAGINASAPPQQLWIDGWLVRFSPGKAKRARCINAVAPGHLSVDAKLALCRPVFATAGLPLLVRVTPFSQPLGLDRHLVSLGMHSVDDTRVMVLPRIDAPRVSAVPVDNRRDDRCDERSDHRIEPVGHAAFALHVGQLRASPLAQRQVHAHRLEQSPVPFSGFVIKDDRGQVVACGQVAIEAGLAGLYDVFTAPPQRCRGLASSLCRHLLQHAQHQGAHCAYLQVEGDNLAARGVYRDLGFVDAYSYHYRSAEPGGGV